MNYGEDTQLQSFPGGNGGFARHMVKTLLPAAIPGPRTLEAVCRVEDAERRQKKKKKKDIALTSELRLEDVGVPSRGMVAPDRDVGDVLHRSARFP